MLDDRECIICNDVEEYAYNELTLVKCKNCDVFFHKICYGISNHSVSNQGIVILCDPCQYELQIKGKQLNKLSSSKDLKCLICFNSGILKRALIPQKFDLFQNSEFKVNHQNRAIWIHIECAIYSQDYITIHNWRSMSNIEILKPLVYVNSESCCFCNGNFGLLRRCRFSQCMVHFHIHCLLKSSSYKHRNIKIEKNHLLEIYCLNHFKSESQISLKQGQKFRKSIIKSLRDEIKTLENSRNLDNYITAILGFNNGELFTFPEFLSSKKDFIGFTLLSIIVSCDIWTLRTTAFLSLAGKPLPKDNSSRFTVTEKSRISRWIHLSKFLPVSAKYVENLISICNQVSDIIEKNRNPQSKLEISNGILSYITNIKLLLDYQSIREWEARHSDYYTLLRDKICGSSLDICKLQEIFQDLPIKHKDNSVLSTLNYSSNLYIVIKGIFNKVQRLDLELNRILKSKTIDIDKLRFIKFKIESEIPGNSPINRTKYNKVLFYSSYLERLLEKRIKELRFNHPRRDLNISRNEDLDHIFGNFFSQFDIIQNTKTLIDSILSLGIEENSNKDYHKTEGGNGCQDLENTLQDWRSSKLNSNYHVISSLNSKNLTKGVTSRKIKSLIQKINNLQRWENMVNECYITLKDLETRCFFSNKEKEPVNKNKNNSTFKEKYRRFLNIMDMFQVKMDSLMQEISLLKRFFDRNKEILIRSNFLSQYEYLLEEHNRVKKLQGLFERDFEPNFNLVLLYVDCVLRSRFCLLPKKSCQISFVSKLERYLYFETYVGNSLKNKEISWKDIIILSQYLDFKVGNAQNQINCEPPVPQDFEILLTKLLNKFSENFNVVSKVYLIIYGSKNHTDSVLAISQDFQSFLTILRHLLKTREILETPVQGLFDYLLAFDSKVKSQSQFWNFEDIKKSESFETEFSFENYRKYFIQLVSETDFDGYFHLIGSRDSNDIIEIPLEYKIRLIQRFYIIETLSILFNRDLYHENIQDLVVRTLKHYDSQLLVGIWRNLRLLDIEESINQDLESLSKAFFQESVNLRKMIKKGFIVNDELYNFVIRHLTERVFVDFGGKGFVYGSIDDYLQDLEYIVKYNHINQSKTIHLISEINEIKQLDESLQKVVQKMNLEDFQHKKKLITRILDQELDFQGDLDSSSSRESLKDTIYLHQPISYDEEMIRDRLDLDFPTKRRNEFFSKVRIDDLFDQESVSIIKSRNPNIQNLSECKDHSKIKRDKSNIGSLVNDYLSIVEEERNQILLILGRSSRYGVEIGSNWNGKEKKLLKFESLFKDLVQKKKVISLTIKLLGYLVNDLMHFEVAFVINMARMTQTDTINDNLVLREWFNEIYLRHKTPYKLFKSAETMFKKDNYGVSLTIFGLIRDISMKYLNFVDNWDEKYLQVIENRRVKDTSREFYDVLLVYNQSKLLKKIFQGDLDSTIIRSHYLSENEIYQRIKSERIKQEYQRIRGLLGDLMVLFKDYMNETFNEIVTNGLYNMKSSSKFLVYFPSCLIESLRNKEFGKFSGNHLRIFIEEISMIYFSKELTLLLVKINLTYKCESFYISPELLVTLSSEIELKSGILIETVFMDSYYYFIKIYKDSLITENYYYIRENSVSQDLIEFVNNKLDEFETKILTEMNSSSNLNELLVNRVEINLKYFKIRHDEGKFKKLGNRFIIISDIIDLISNIILYRVFVDGLLVNDQFNKKIHVFRRNHSLLDFDLALKSMVMYFSLRDVVENSFPRTERMRFGDEIFAPVEIFSVSKELSTLIELFNIEEISTSIKNRPKIHHYLFEKEYMLMEDFRGWEIASDSYLFKENFCFDQSSGSEFHLNTILWVPEYENFNTVLDIIDLILFHIKKIKSCSLGFLDLKEVSDLINSLEIRRKGILGLEENSLETLKQVKQDETENSRFETNSKDFLLLEKVIHPPKISQKVVYDLISKKLAKLIPNFKLLYQSLNILPFKGFEILNKYFKNSVITDKTLSLILNKIGDLETRHDPETKQDFEGILSHNFEYLLKIMELRRLISESKLSSEILYRAYLKFFRGIFRYFLVYGSSHRWVDVSQVKDQKEAERKEIFVPILEYGVLRRLYIEFLSWYKFSKDEINLKGVFQNCEFIILECFLSCCKYLMEKISFNSEKMEDEYLINHCILRYLYFQQDSEYTDKFVNFNLMIGILDIGEYLSNYLSILDMELIMRQDFFKIKNSDIPNDKYQLGSFSVFSRVDNKLVHHFLRKNKIQVSICGLKDPRFGLISNIYYIRENKQKIDFKWSIGRIYYSLKPINGVYFLRSYVKQYLEYVFKAFYNRDDQDYIKKKDHSLYLEAFGTEDQLSIENLFQVLDKYLKDVMDYSLRLMLKSFKIKSYGDHSSYSNLSKYPDLLENLKSKWMIFGQEKWISELIQVEIQNRTNKSSNKKRIREEKREGGGNRVGDRKGVEEQVLVDNIDQTQASIKLKKKNLQHKEIKKRNIELNSEMVNCLEGKKEVAEKEKEEKENEKEEKGGEVKEGARGGGEGGDIVYCERLKDHEGIKSDLKFAWLGWLSFGREQENGDDSILEIGIYQISSQFTKRSDSILRELGGCLDLRYNGIKHSMNSVGRALGNNSVVVLISSNWSHHLRFCKSQVFSRIFYYNYNYEDYEIFEFEMAEKKNPIGDVRLWIFPCNLNDEDSNRLFFSGNTTRKRSSSLLLPISRYYLIGMLVLNSEVTQNYHPSSGICQIQDQDQDEEISVLTSLLPNQGQMHKIAQYCHNKSMKSDSKMEFLINNDMFSSAGTLLSSLLSVNNSSNHMNKNSSSSSNEQDNYYSSNICTLRDLASSIKRKISQGLD
ncbi:protein with two PHD Zn fingers [Cryptosporidium sp. chipmunk genotype I]|uniref:protein with two PHD Zn fingers n=1 Tax=Cryptosporidium sp. chipmunk genotype I TaxID=1280935 RepID=UPI003519F36B|nr:protein with two PHD Zn fingers [Cryptosporidium sp. chipmunk genotype I]